MLGKLLLVGIFLSKCLLDAQEIHVTVCDLADLHNKTVTNARKEADFAFQSAHVKIRWHDRDAGMAKGLNNQPCS